MSWISFILNFLLYILILVVALSYWWLQRRSNYWNERNILGPKPTWMFLAGNMLGVGRTDSWNSRLNQIYNEYKDKSPAVGFFASVVPTLLITDLELAKTILVRDFAKFDDHGFYYNEEDDPLSAHLGSFEGAKWRVFRTKLSPAFSSGRIKTMFSAIEQIGDRFVEVLDELARSKTAFDAKNLSSRFSADVLGSTAFGIDIDCLDNPENKFFDVMKKLLESFKVTSPSVMFKMTFQDLSRKLHLAIIPKHISAFFMNMLRQTVDYREQNDINRNDFLQLLIQLKNNGILDGETGEQETENLTFNQIAAQAFIFFFAGFENSSTAMKFSLYHIASHVDVQDKAREEILEKIVKYDGRLTYEALMEMEYLNQIFNESMRLNPPVFAMLRRANQNYVIPGTNMRVDKNTSVIVSNYVFHKDPQYFPDPEKFDPERFTKENIASRHPMTFFPYGDGPRNCIGYKFAQLQSRFAIALLLKNFKLTVNKKTKLPLKFHNNHPGWSVIGGVWLNVERISEESGGSSTKLS